MARHMRPLPLSLPRCSTSQATAGTSSHSPLSTLQTVSLLFLDLQHKKQAERQPKQKKLCSAQQEKFPWLCVGKQMFLHSLFKSLINFSLKINRNKVWS
jgi:hypothetical protein